MKRVIFNQTTCFTIDPKTYVKGVEYVVSDRLLMTLDPSEFQVLEEMPEPSFETNTARANRRFKAPKTTQMNAKLIKKK